MSRGVPPGAVQGGLGVRSGSRPMVGDPRAPRGWSPPANSRHTRSGREGMTTTTKPAPVARGAAPGTTGQVLVDGAMLLPRSVAATHALLTGEGVEAYRRTFPRPPATMTSSPTRVATHVVAGLALGLLALLVVSGLVLSLIVSPLLLAPAGGLTLVGLAGLGALHDVVTRRLIDRS